MDVYAYATFTDADEHVEVELQFEQRITSTQSGVAERYKVITMSFEEFVGSVWARENFEWPLGRARNKNWVVAKWAQEHDRNRFYDMIAQGRVRLTANIFET